MFPKRLCSQVNKFVSFIFVFAELVYRTNDAERLMCQRCTGVAEAASNWTIMRWGPDYDVYIDDIKFTNSSIQVAGGEMLELKNLDTYSEGQYSCRRSTGGECRAGCIFIQGDILYYIKLGRTGREIERARAKCFHRVCMYSGW